MGTDIGEEINNKIYFKDEGGNMQEIGSTEDFNLIEVETDNIKISSSEFDAKLASKSVFSGELSVSFSDGEKFFSRIRKTLGYSILKPKRFKKLLMSIGFDRNEAEWINETFKFFGKHRYECFINGYKDLVPGIKLVIKDAKKEAR